MRGGEKMNYVQKLSTAISTAALVASSFTPAVLAGDYTISGNGEGSSNNITVNNTCTQDVLQRNRSYVSVNASASSNTGNNTASGNTGDGGVNIDTGNSNASVNVVVEGNFNEANLTSCCNCLSTGNATVNNNGANSTNNITVNNTVNQTVTQRNRTRVRIKKARARSNTGNNTASGNTGNGTVNVTTGNSNASVNVTVNGSSNILLP